MHCVAEVKLHCIFSCRNALDCVENSRAEISLDLLSNQVLERIQNLFAIEAKFSAVIIHQYGPRHIICRLNDNLSLVGVYTPTDWSIFFCSLLPEKSCRIVSHREIPTTFLSLISVVLFFCQNMTDVQPV